MAVDLTSLEEGRPSTNPVVRLQSTTVKYAKTYKQNIKITLFLLFLVGFSIYLGFAIARSISGATPIIVITCIVLVFRIHSFISRKYGKKISNYVINPCCNALDKRWIKWSVCVLLLILIILYLVFFVVVELQQLQSLSGFVIFLFIPWITCRTPDQINWRPVLWGIGTQFVMGVLVLRWRTGYQAVKAVADELNNFLSYSAEGAAAVFGDPFFLFHPFVFLVVPLVIYLGSVIAILFHIGAVQWFTCKIGWLMVRSFKITAVESLSLTANIFLSVMDTMLLMRPYLVKMTESEFHTLLVGSHATIAGFAFGLFVLFGVSPQHLLTGAIMSAPAAVAISKLNFPETEKSVLLRSDDVKVKTNEDENIVEAASQGAYAAAKSVTSIVIQVLAFIGIYTFLNTCVGYIGSRVGIELSFEIILSYIFMPLSFVMGVKWSESRAVSTILGMKLMFNEVLAFLDLGQAIQNGQLSDRSATIATYAICGFSSVGTLFIFVGVWATVDRSRLKQVSAQLPRVFLNANISCFLTACIAGLFYSEDVVVARGASRNETAGLNLLDLLPGYKEIFDFLDRRTS